MNLSYKILSVKGIDIELHLTFLAFIFGLLIFNFNLAVLLLIVFLFVTIHELCHSLVAIHKGMKVKKIVLLPIGGMAMINTSKIDPITEIQMSLAGPMFNFFMCYVFMIIMVVLELPLSNALDVIQQMHFSPELLIYYSFYANLILGSFNLFLPAFPLDGGRVLRSLLALKIDMLKATRIARNISLFIAGLLFLFAFLSSDLWIMIISMFIAFGAIAEYQGLANQKLLANIKVIDILSKDFMVVQPNDFVFKLLPEMISFKTLTVVVNSNPVAIADIRSVEEFSGDKSKLSFAHISKPVLKFTLRSSVEKIVNFMNMNNISMVPIFEQGKIIGVVKRIDIERIKQMKQALGKGFKLKKSRF